MPTLPIPSLALAVCCVCFILPLQGNQFPIQAQVNKPTALPDVIKAKAPPVSRTCSVALTLSRNARTHSETLSKLAFENPFAEIYLFPLAILDAVTNGWVNAGFERLSQFCKGCQVLEGRLSEFFRETLGFKPRPRKQWTASVNFEVTIDADGEPLTKKCTFTKAKGAEEADWYLPIPYLWIFVVVHTRDEWEFKPIKQEQNYHPKFKLFRCRSQFQCNTKESIRASIWLPGRSLSWTLSSDQWRNEVGTFATDFDLGEPVYQANISFFANSISISGPKDAQTKDFEKSSGVMTEGPFTYTSVWRKITNLLPGD